MATKLLKNQRKIEIINPAQFAKSYQDYLQGKTAFAERPSKDFLMTQFNTGPLSGHEQPKEFPMCCKWHTKIYHQALEKFNEFPGCCDHHKPIAFQNWFDKSNYMYLPMKTVNTIAFMIHCIRTSIDNPNWYKELRITYNSPLIATAIYRQFNLSDITINFLQSRLVI